MENFLEAVVKASQANVIFASFHRRAQGSTGFKPA
jgi:hypothetical protein